MIVRGTSLKGLKPVIILVGLLMIAARTSAVNHEVSSDHTLPGEVLACAYCLHAGTDGDSAGRAPKLDAAPRAHAALRKIPFARTYIPADFSGRPPSRAPPATDV